VKHFLPHYCEVKETVFQSKNLHFDAFCLFLEPPNQVAQRQLVLIAKVLQSLANMANTKKEQFMDNMSDFLEKNIPKMKQFYDNLLVHFTSEKNKSYDYQYERMIVFVFFFLDAEFGYQNKSKSSNEFVCSSSCERKCPCRIAHSHLSK
jgi:hypothetical protein